MIACCGLREHLLGTFSAAVSSSLPDNNFILHVFVAFLIEFPLVGGGGGEPALPLTRLIGRIVHVSTTATQVSLNTHEGLYCSESSSSRAPTLSLNDSCLFFALSVNHTERHQDPIKLTFRPTNQNRHPEHPYWTSAWHIVIELLSSGLSSLI